MCICWQANDTKHHKVSDVDTVMPTPSAVQVIKRTQFEKYFDTRWESKRAFRSSLEAHATARTSLGRRQEDMLKFLNLIIKRVSALLAACAVPLLDALNLIVKRIVLLKKHVL